MIQAGISSSAIINRRARKELSVTAELMLLRLLQRRLQGGRSLRKGPLHFPSFAHRLSGRKFPSLLCQLLNQSWRSIVHPCGQHPFYFVCRKLYLASDICKADLAAGWKHPRKYVRYKIYLSQSWQHWRPTWWGSQSTALQPLPAYQDFGRASEDLCIGGYGNNFQRWTTEHSPQTLFSWPQESSHFQAALHTPWASVVLPQSQPWWRGSPRILQQRNEISHIASLRWYC